MFIQEIAGEGHIAYRITDGFHCAENKDQKFVEETTDRILGEIKDNKKNKVVDGGIFGTTSEVIKELLLKSAEELFGGTPGLLTKAA